MGAQYNGPGARAADRCDPAHRVPGRPHCSDRPVFSAYRIAERSDRFPAGSRGGALEYPADLIWEGGTMRLGFIGLGIMGGAMAANLLKAGWPLMVHDIRRDAAERHLAAGATWAESPATMAASCDTIFSCLPDLHAIETVTLGPDGILSRAQPGTALFEM